MEQSINGIVTPIGPKNDGHCDICGETFHSSERNGKVIRIPYMCPHKLARIQATADARAKAEKYGRWRTTYKNILPDVTFSSTSLAELDDDMRSLAGKKLARRIVETWPERLKAGEGAAFIGDQGTGKTAVMCALHVELHRRLETCIFISSIQLLDMLRDFEEGNTRLLYAALVTANALFIDDIGKEKLTHWGASKMFGLFDERYRAKLPVFFTSNYGGAELQAHLISQLTDGPSKMLYGDAKLLISPMLTRLSERCAGATFKGADRRKGKKHAWVEETQPTE